MALWPTAKPPNKSPFPTERVDKAAHSLEDPTVPKETIERRAKSVTENCAESMHDDYIKENAGWRSQAGLDCYLVRDAGGGCCPWCQGLEGRYDYATAPDDIFRRHDNCTCSVTYECGRQRQDVWSKKTWQASEDELKARKEAEAASKPVKLTKAEAIAKESEILAQRRLTYDAKRGIILSNNNIPRLEATSPFKNPSTPLIIDDIMQSKHIKNGKRYNDYMQSHQYEPSILTIDKDKIQELVNRYHGTGILKYDKNGKIIDSEIIIDNDEVVGYVSNNQNGATQPTTAFKIQYGKNGTHIVPTYESQKQYWKERRNQNGYDWLLRQKG